MRRPHQQAVEGCANNVLSETGTVAHRKGFGDARHQYDASNQPVFRIDPLAHPQQHRNSLDALVSGFDCLCGRCRNVDAVVQHRIKSPADSGHCIAVSLVWGLRHCRRDANFYGV